MTYYTKEISLREMVPIYNFNKHNAGAQHDILTYFSRCATFTYFTNLSGYTVDKAIALDHAKILNDLNNEANVKFLKDFVYAYGELFCMN